MKIKKYCQYCGKEYYIEKCREKRNKFCSDKCFRNSRNTKVEYNCDYCGKIFLIQKSRVDQVKSGKRKGLYCCPQCAKDIQKPKWDDIVTLFKDKGYELLSTEYISAKKKLEYVCKKHIDKGIQSITYGNIKSGFGCKYCGDEKMASKRRLSFDEVKMIFDKHDMVLLEQPYKNTTHPMAYICKHHPEIGIQYMSTSNAYKQRCPYCHIVKGEKEISRYLNANNIVYEKEKTFEGLVGVKGGKLRYDFYLPEYNILIEYQGEQHEHPIGHFGGDDQFKVQIEHDKRKKECANMNNMKLLEIWYYDFNNISTILTESLKRVS